MLTPIEDTNGFGPLTAYVIATCSSDSIQVMQQHSPGSAMSSVGRVVHPGKNEDRSRRNEEGKGFRGDLGDAELFDRGICVVVLGLRFT